MGTNSYPAVTSEGWVWIFVICGNRWRVQRLLSNHRVRHFKLNRQHSILTWFIKAAPFLFGGSPASFFLPNIFGIFTLLKLRFLAVHFSASASVDIRRFRVCSLRKNTPSNGSVIFTQIFKHVFDSGRNYDSETKLIWHRLAVIGRGQVLDNSLVRYHWFHSFVCFVHYLKYLWLHSGDKHSRGTGPRMTCSCCWHFAKAGVRCVIMSWHHDHVAFKFNAWPCRACFTDCCTRRPVDLWFTHTFIYSANKETHRVPPCRTPWPVIK